MRTQAQQVQRHQEGVLRHIFSLETGRNEPGGAVERLHWSHLWCLPTLEALLVEE